MARQLNISVAMENMVSDAFIGVATEIFSTGTQLVLNLKVVVVMKSELETKHVAFSQTRAASPGSDLYFYRFSKY